MKDRFDMLIGVLLLVCGTALVALLIGGGSQSSQASQTVDKALERDLAYRAKISYLQQLYAPVTELQEAGKYESALLKLDELARRYPDEAHGELLRGELLLKLKAVPQSLVHLSRAVRMNGDYVDLHSPLSRRTLIESLLSEQLPRLKEQASRQNSSVSQAALKNLYYLQGRLAGGCE